MEKLAKLGLTTLETRFSRF